MASALIESIHNEQSVVDFALENGGGTFVADFFGASPVKFENGFMVAIPGRERIVPTAEFTADTVSAYLAEFDTELSAGANYLGIWISGESVYLDISEFFDAFLPALNAGIERKQIAIWDNRGNREIECL